MTNFAEERRRLRDAELCHGCHHERREHLAFDGGCSSCICSHFQHPVTQVPLSPSAGVVEFPKRKWWRFW